MRKKSDRIQLFWLAVIMIGLMALLAACSEKGASDASSQSTILPSESPAESASVSPSSTAQDATPAAADSATPAANPETPAASAKPAATTAASSPSSAPKPTATIAASKTTPKQASTPTPAPTPQKSPKEQIVNVQASFFVWKLDQTTVKAGTPVHFKVTSKEGLHGFSIEETDVAEEIDEGDMKDVFWTPKKAGTYTIRCNEYCGSGHADMAVKITVT